MCGLNYKANLVTQTMQIKLCSKLLLTTFVEKNKIIDQSIF